MRELKMNLRRVKKISWVTMVDGRVIITGVNGFIGSHLARILQEYIPNMEIIGIDRVTLGNKEILQVDLLDRTEVAHIVQKNSPEFIFHMAGVVYSSDLKELYRGNVQTTVNLLDAVKAVNKPLRVIIPGSAAEYGRIAPVDLPLSEEHLPNPVTPYGVTKVWQTTVARYYATQGVDVQIGRIFNVVGKGMPEGLSIGAFAGQLKKIKTGVLPPRLTVGNLKSKRDFVDIKDVCRGFLAMAEKGRSGEIYNISSGRSVSIEDVLYMMIKQLNVDVSIVIDPARMKEAEIDDICGDSNKLTYDTDWEPNIPISVSVEQIIDL